jgi:hypothetical protein
LSFGVVEPARLQAGVFYGAKGSQREGGGEKTRREMDGEKGERRREGRETGGNGVRMWKGEGERERRHIGNPPKIPSAFALRIFARFRPLLLIIFKTWILNSILKLSYD